MNISIYYYLLALISGVELKASNAITEGTRCKRATYIIIIDNLMYGIGQGNINDFWHFHVAIQCKCVRQPGNLFLTWELNNYIVWLRTSRQRSEILPTTMYYFLVLYLSYGIIRYILLILSRHGTNFSVAFAIPVKRICRYVFNNSKSAGLRPGRSDCWIKCLGGNTGGIHT